MTARDIDTARLTMRPHVIADFDDSFALWTDPRTVAFIGGTPSTRDRGWQRILIYAGLWSLTGFGYWSVRDRATGTFIGEVGFADFHRGIEPSTDGEPEMGWAIAPDHYGKGYATEAVIAALAWADAALPYPRTICMIDPANTASIAVARKAGFAEWTATVFSDKTLQLYQRAITR